MRNLLKNERTKQYRKVSTWIILGVVALLLVFMLLVMRLNNRSYSWYTSWQDLYVEQVRQYESMLNDAGSSETGKADSYAAAMAKGYRYLLDHDIPPQDWRVDAILGYYEETGYAANTEAQLAVPELSQEETAVLQTELAQHKKAAAQWKTLWDKDDWKAYAAWKRDTAEQSFTVLNEAEITVEKEIWQMMIDQNIQPVSQIYQEQFSYYSLPGIEENWKLTELASLRTNKLALLRGETERGDLIGEKTRISMEQSIAISQKRLATDTPPIAGTSFLGYLDAGAGQMSLLAIFLIVVAGGLVAGEFGSGTIKLLLITPHKRSSIFWSKCLLLLELSLIGLGVMLVTATVCSLIFAGAQGIGSFTVISLFGHVCRLPALLAILGKYLLCLLPVLVLTAMSLMLSTVTRKSSVSIALSMVLMYGCSMVLTIVSSFGVILPGLKFLLFANTDLTLYFSDTSASLFGGGLVDPGMTLGFSLLVLGLYLVCFLWTARDSFCRRDIR